MQLTGSHPEDCVYVGDNPKKDFIGARKLGWYTIRIRRPHGEHNALEPEPGFEAHREITSLRDLPSLLDI